MHQVIQRFSTQISPSSNYGNPSIQHLLVSIYFYNHNDIPLVTTLESITYIASELKLEFNKWNFPL